MCPLSQLPFLVFRLLTSKNVHSLCVMHFLAFLGRFLIIHIQAFPFNGLRHRYFERICSKEVEKKKRQTSRALSDLRRGKGKVKAEGGGKIWVRSGNLKPDRGR